MEESFCFVFLKYIQVNHNFFSLFLNLLYLYLSDLIYLNYTLFNYIFICADCLLFLFIFFIFYMFLFFDIYFWMSEFYTCWIYDIQKNVEKRILRLL